MKLTFFLSYNDIFEDLEPKIEDLLYNIPSNVLISVMSYFNCQLYLDNSTKTQMKILEQISSRFELSFKKHVFEKLNSFFEKDGDTSLFTVISNLELIHYSLINYSYREVEELTPQDEVNLFKAYLIVSKKITSKVTINNDLTEKDDMHSFFRKSLWPAIFGQVEFSMKDNHIVSLIRGVIFLSYFKENGYSENVNYFLKRNGCKGEWDYIINIMNLLDFLYKSKKNKQAFFSIDLNLTKGTFLESFVMDPVSYKNKFCRAHKNYIGFREKPIYRDNNSLIVIHWSFISNKLYEGLLFDFYRNSNINKERRFNKFVDFKNYIAENITEQSLFRKLLPEYIKSKKPILKFDDNTQQGFPDAYYRNGKYLYLFELKDAYFSSNAVESYSFEKIKNVIDVKYNSNSKGTGQLVKYLKKLEHNLFEGKNYREAKLKREKLVVYPIIVYSDPFFSSPGVNKYLSEEFQKRIELERLDHSFGEIKRLVFVNISYFIENIDNAKKIRFKEILDYYNSSILNLEKRHNRTKELELLHEINESFEVFADEYLEKKNIKSLKFVFKRMVEVMDLKLA